MTVLEELHRVIGLDEAVINRNERKVMQILSSKDSLWEDVSYSFANSSATYLCELADAKAAKKNETGGSWEKLLFSHLITILHEFSL